MNRDCDDDNDNLERNCNDICISNYSFVRQFFASAIFASYAAEKVGSNLILMNISQLTQ